jgi:hypothetical protein
MLSDDEAGMLMDRLVRPTVPSLISNLLGIGSVSKDWRRAYHAKKTNLDGSVLQTEEDWFRIRGGVTFEEESTDGDTLQEPFSIRIVREDKPGRPVRIFLVRDDAVRGGRSVERADRIAARIFVSVFCTKDANRQIWKSAEFSNPGVWYHAREVEAATCVRLPIVGQDVSIWPAVFPDLRSMVQDHNRYFQPTGDIAIHVPSEVGERPQPFGDPNNRPAVFERRLLQLAGKFEDHLTLNAVPGVISVNTPTEFRSSHPLGSHEHREELCKHLREKDAFLKEQLAAPPPPGGWILCSRLDGMQEPAKKRAAAQTAVEKIANQTNLINATNSTGGLPVALKPSAVQENDDNDGVQDARFDTDSEEDEDDEGDDEDDSDYAP